MKKGHKGDTKFANETDAKKPIEDYGNQLLVRAEQDAELGVSPGYVGDFFCIFLYFF